MTVREKRKTVFVRILCVLVTLVTSSVAFGQAIPQKNVNVIGPTPVRWLYAGNPRMQQNEPECAVSPNNPEWLACGFNDYRGVNDPAIGDAFPGMSMSRDLGKSWFSGLGPGNLGETPNIGQKFGADANLEALPNLLLYNFIAGWRDDSQPGGVYVSRWYEHNRDVGPPWEALDIIEVDLGTSGKFLDKPAFDLTLRDPRSWSPGHRDSDTCIFRIRVIWTIRTTSIRCECPLPAHISVMRFSLAMKTTTAQKLTVWLPTMAAQPGPSRAS